MGIRKYAGVGLGLVLSLGMAASVMADQIGPNHVTTVHPGWNSAVWVDNTQNTTYFWIQQCLSSATTARFDLMHHWFGFPSTGTAVKILPCANTTNWQQASWGNVATADYSIEYTQSNSATATYWYEIQY